MNKPTLPGDIPGLLKSGLWIVDPKTGIDVLCTRVNQDIAQYIPDCELTQRVCLLSQTAMILDEAGCDRAVRWLAEKLGMKAGTTAPCWDVHFRGRPEVPVYCLTCGGDIWVFTFGETYMGRRETKILGHTPADAIDALRLAVLHVAEVTL